MLRLNIPSQSSGLPMLPPLSAASPVPGLPLSSAFSCQLAHWSTGQLVCLGLINRASGPPSHSCFCGFAAFASLAHMSTCQLAS